MTFEVGQIVTVSNPATLYTQQFQDARAVVTNVAAMEAFPYEVTFSNGQTLGFAEEELSPVPTEGTTSDPVNSPAHYTWLPNGLEVIDVTQHFNFNLGNALKYIMRAGRKGDTAEDLRKAARYLEFELTRLESN
ncbi:DUF3310 domain-containing protein [Streptomyces graminilatus]|uniref:DUF3310 domain-containing protein n=1 Tax=Streptomyces graminilatus TaxID=1464070 RepID=UPI000A7E40FC|nr:DUF3310 domain-containing protein [Streptomyces graminilatus]